MSQTRALLVTDVVDSTALSERIGDAATAEAWIAHDRAARDLLVPWRGREIDKTDGMLLMFEHAADAVGYSLAYHSALAALAVPMTARAGLHVGPVILRENRGDDIARGAKPIEVEGMTKPLAARLMGLARGGQTLLSESAQQAVGAPVDAIASGAWLEDHGHYRMKGITDPVHVFELGVDPHADRASPADVDKAYRVVWKSGLWQPAREVHHNLPAERDAFVGRQDELHALATRLDAGVRLMTLLGAGGTGKTRLIQRYALQWLGDWPGGVYFCDLSEARSLDGIMFAVASALGVPLVRDEPAKQLGHVIAGRGHCLIILDNFEQVAGHAADTLGHWLDRTSDATFAVTSRERLHLRGEEVLPIEPLRLRDEAIELFEARARALEPTFLASPANRAAVAEVVKLLDGLPLAIELAAARVRVMSAEQIADRLKDRFALLSGARGTTARQATLRAAIDWSWNLLQPWEQAALAQCSVFEGGFTLDAAEAVIDLSGWAGAPPVVDAVQALVDKCLLRAWMPKSQRRLDIDEPYFGMYLSVHEYAAGRLHALGTQTVDETMRRHGACYAAFGTAEEMTALKRSGGIRRLQQLATEIDNLVAACRRAIARGDGMVSVQCFVAIWEVLYLQGPFSLALELGDRVLTLDSVTGVSRAETLLTLASAVRQTGRSLEAQGRVDEALTLARQAGSRRLESRALASLGDLYRRTGRADEATASCLDALAIDQESGDRDGVIRNLLLLSLLYQEQGHYAEACTFGERALAMARELGDRRSEGTALDGLGIALHLQGELALASDAYERAIAIHREVGNRTHEGVSRGNLGDLLCDEGKLQPGADSLQRALALHREVGNRHFEARVLGNLASAFHEMGRYDEARAGYEEALVIFRQIDGHQALGSVHGNLGLLHQLQKRPDAARLHFEEALAIHRRQGHRRGEGIVLGSLGLLLAEEGNFDAARRALRDAEVLLREIGDRLALGKVLCKRGFAEVRAGSKDDARSALLAAESIAEQMSIPRESELRREIEALRSTVGS